jgi:aminoglycoside phosphotransferase (APT) family kinase protein
MPKLTNQSKSNRARKFELEKIAQAIEMAHQMPSMWVPIYMPSALQLGRPYMSLTFVDGTSNAINVGSYLYAQRIATWQALHVIDFRYSSEGKVFFGPSAKGFRSRRSLNLLNTKTN